MEISRQNQTAGDNAQQVQVGNATNLTIVNGITEQRARDIFREMNHRQLQIILKMLGRKHYVELEYLKPS